MSGSFGAFSVPTNQQGALVTLSRVLAKELGPRRIRVNAVAPAATETKGAHAIAFRISLGFEV
jgi:3-oxoacyl-[acyl-carrier protein] reductase